MSIRIIRFFQLAIIVIVCAHFIPMLYWMKFEKSIRPPQVFYSPVLSDFMITSFSDAPQSELRWKDTKGNLYNRDQYDSLLPFLNYRQLAALNKLPASINGIPVSLDSIRLNGFIYRIAPKDIDQEEIKLYSMLESKSGRIRLDMPSDFFRINDRIEFIESKTNLINEEKSIMFTNELIVNSFAFPAKSIAGNPTTRKPFDEGYFVVDQNDNLFHIKMVRGKPFCVNTGVPSDLNIVHIAPIEMTQREFYGYIFTADNKVYLLSYNNYKLIEIPVKNYNFKTDGLQIYGDLFYRTIVIRRYDNIEVFVTDRSYKTVNHYKEKWEGKYESTTGIAAGFIFPFSIDFTDEDSAFYSAFIKFSDYRSLFLIFLSLAAAILIIRYRKQSIAKSTGDLILVLFTGIYGLIAIAAIKNIE